MTQGFSVLYSTNWATQTHAPQVGLEPTTLWLTATCSTSWAIEEDQKGIWTPILGFATQCIDRLYYLAQAGEGIWTPAFQSHNLTL